jgi:uncharacterized protein (DUF1501 family)
MKRTKLTRRQFLTGCSSAIAAMAGARLTRLALAAPDAPNASQEILVVVFLRGGWDALNVIPVIGGADRGAYETARESLKVPASGTGAAINLNGQFGFHPSLAPLHDLYQNGNLAVIQAVGLTSDTRSHFDAMQFIELGTPDNKSTPTGWITRHLETGPALPGTILLPALSAGSSQAMSLLGSQEAAAMTSPDDFSFSGHWNYSDPQRVALRNLYNGDTWLYQAGTQTLDTIDLIESLNPGSYVPSNGAVYPSGSFGDNLQAIAQMIKMDVGLHVATIDLGGWDTHEHQGDGSTGYLADLLNEFASGLDAFYTDLNGSGPSNYASRLTVVVQSEFGRRLRENANHGTDHGHGSAMLVMGGNVNGGMVYGNWPGLSVDQLYEGADLDVTTDYRQVLAEILTDRLLNPNLDYVFPGLTSYQPLGIVRTAYTVPPGLDQRLYLPNIKR